MKPIPPPTAQQDQEWNRLGDFANGIVKKINAVNANAILQHFQLRVMEAADTLLVLRRTPNAGVHARDSATVLRSQYDAMMQAVYLLTDPPLFNERVQLFECFKAVELHKQLQLLKKYPPKWMLTPEFKTRIEPGIEKRFSEVRDCFAVVNKQGKSKGLRRHWYKGSLSRLAKHYKYEEEYSHLLFKLNQAVHTSPLATPDSLRETVDHMPIWGLMFAFRILGRLAAFHSIRLSDDEAEVTARANKDVFTPENQCGNGTRRENGTEREESPTPPRH